MRVLILGGTGMLGHKLWQVCRGSFDTWVTTRLRSDADAAYGLFDRDRTVGHVAVEDIDGVVRAIATVRPDAVVNAIGIVKQQAAGNDPLVSLTVNALLPHRLAQVCRAGGIRLIQISTDCVFSGRKGRYTEADVSDAEDLYGRTKFLGELGAEGCLTLRTSMIGRELATSHGLLEWFLAQAGGTVRGYRRAIFSGFTTLALSGIIRDVLADHRDLEGLWHVASEPISKLELLTLLRDGLSLDVRIEPDDGVVVDRSLDGTRFRQRTAFIPPRWPAMIERLAEDPTPYEKIRGRRADG